MEHPIKIIPIDDDHKIHILNVLSRYHSIQEDHVKDAILNDIDPDLELFSLYLLGNIEGRLLAGGELTEKDMDYIIGMEEELKDADNEVVEVKVEYRLEGYVQINGPHPSKRRKCVRYYKAESMSEAVATAEREGMDVENVRVANSDMEDIED